MSESQPSSECPPLNENIIKTMKSNKRKDTGPELKLRKALREAKMSGYRLQWKVPGHPDICYPGKKVAVFVNGCFWHRCPYCNLPMPKHNQEYWSEKFRKNIIRDEIKSKQLAELGWTVVVVWECEINKELQLVVERIAKALMQSKP